MLSILLIVSIVIVVILVLASRSSDHFRVERSTNVNATPVEVFALLKDFHQWINWSPWERLDPAMQRTYSGATSGKGAIYEWEGNKAVGKGRMEITEVEPNSRLRIKLDFFMPFEAHNTAEFSLTSNGAQTVVSWAMSGPAALPLRLMRLFMNMDKMIGKDFENGLVNLKALAEKN